jgi:DNA modification methylase
MINWHLEVLSIKKLKDHPKNPRQINKEQLAHLKTLIKKFGLIDKPIVNLDKTIIGGHQRIRILKKMKAKTVECWVPDRLLEDEEIDHLCIGLNLNQGEFDYDILANEWNELDLLKWGFSEEQLLGMSEKEGENTGSLEDDEDEIEIDETQEPITQQGDLYVLGGHLLICGDSTSSDTVNMVMGNHNPIIMVTDPPYGVNYDPTWKDKALKDEAKRSTGKVENDNQIDWSKAYALFSGAIVYIWCASLFLSKVEQHLNSLDFDLKSLIIWYKQHFSLSRGNYHWKHEACWYAVKRGCKHNWKGDRKQTTVWEIANLNCFGKNQDEDERTDHSTQKPLECMARPIRNHTIEGDYVYDPFLGSGTTLIAAERLNRKCIGIELSPVYCDVIVNRWINYRKKNDLSCEFTCNGIRMDSLNKKE